MGADLAKPADEKKELGESGEKGDKTTPTGQDRNVDPVKLLESGAAAQKTLAPVSDVQLSTITKAKSETVVLGADKTTVSDKVEARLKLDTPVIDFVKTEPVRAEVFAERTSWNNTVGAANSSEVQWAEKGDFKVYEKDGVNWYVVSKDQFLKTYVPNPGFNLPRDVVSSNTPAERAAEFIKLGLVKAQVLPEGSWKVGSFAGQGGDYLMENWKGEQYIVPKAEFENLYSPTKAEAGQESLRLPKSRTGQEIARPELGDSITSESWDKGQIFRDKSRNTITITDTEAGTFSVYNVDPESPEHLRNRLIVKHEKVGDHLVTRNTSYELSERLAQTEESQKLLSELYAKGSKYNELEQTALSLPNTMTPEYEAAYNQTAAGQQESREQLRQRLETERIVALVNGDGTTGGFKGAKKVGFDDPRYRPKLDIVIGLPAAGKSNYIEQLKKDGFAEIESDEIKTRLPEFNLKPGDPEYERLKSLGINLTERNGLGATSLMQESNMINDRVLDHMMKEGYNIVLPGVGLNREWTEKFIKEAQAKGYDVSLTIIDTMPADAIKGAIGRYERDGRYVNPRFIGTHGERPSQNFAAISHAGIREGWLEGFTRVWNQPKKPGVDYPNKIVESATRLGMEKTAVFERKLALGKADIADSPPDSIKVSESSAKVELNVDDAIKAIKEGKLDSSKQYTIKIDSSLKNKGGRNEAAELFAAIKETQGAITLDKGYHEAPFYKQTGEGIISTSESKIALGKELTLKIGDKMVTLPPGKVNSDKSTEGTVFPNGTIIDMPSGKIRNIDPAQKGVMVNGHFIENGTVIPKDAISTNDRETGQGFQKDSWLKARKTVDENGKPILDTHPIDEKTFGKKWDKVGEALYGTKKSPTEHAKLPDNVTVLSKTEYSDGKYVGLDPGTYIRADGYSVTQKDLVETWNGYAGDEKAYEYMKSLYAAKGMQDSPQAKMMEENRDSFRLAVEQADKLKGIDLDALARKAASEIISDRKELGSAKQQRDLLLKSAFVSGSLISKEEIKTWAETGKISEDVIAALEQRMKGGLQADSESVELVLAALRSKAADIQSETAKSLANQILEQTAKMQREAATERKAELAKDMKPSGMSLVALAAVAASILAYTHPEESKALIRKVTSKLGN